MKQCAPENIKKRASTVFRLIASSFALVLAVMALITLTRAWLDRTVDDTSGVGFALQKKGTVMAKTYSIETYYYGLDLNWHLITTDYERFEGTDGSGKDWTTEWDDNNGLLIPGSKSEYKTVIKNLMPYDMTVSMFLGGISVDADLEKLVVIGASEPQVSIYTPEDTGYFVNPGDGTPITATLLPLCKQEMLAAESTMTIRWYINTSSNVVGGTFPILLDKTTRAPISGGEDCYYYINGTDGDGVPSEAYLCTARGVLIFDKARADYTEFDGDYSGTMVGSISFGEIDNRIKVSDIYVAVG